MASDSVAKTEVGDDECGEFLSKGSEHFTAVHSDIRSKLTAIYRNKKLADFTIKCQGQSFKVHKLILALGSALFEDVLICRSEKEVATLSQYDVDCDPSLVEMCLQFLYAGEIRVAKPFAKELSEAADKLGILSLRDQCDKALYTGVIIVAQNCMMLWKLGQRLGDTEMCNRARAGALCNFSDVQFEEGFMECDWECISNYLTSKDLLVESEDERVIAGLRWVNAERDLRIKHLPILLKALPLTSMTQWVLKQSLHDPAVRRCSESKAMLNQAIGDVKNAQNQKACDAVDSGRGNQSANWTVIPGSTLKVKDEIPDPLQQSLLSSTDSITDIITNDSEEKSFILQKSETTLDEKERNGRKAGENIEPTTSASSESSTTEDTETASKNDTIEFQTDINDDSHLAIVGMQKYTSGKLSEATRVVYAYPLSLKSPAKVLTSLPVTVSADGRAACCSSGNLLYVSGIGYQFDEVWSYDRVRDKWEHTGRLRKGRHGHCMVMSDGCLYVLGGWSETANTVERDVEVLTGSTWEVAGQVRGDRCVNCCGYVHGDDILLYGIMNENFSTSLQVFLSSSHSVTHSVTVTEMACLAYGLLVAGDHVILCDDNKVRLIPVNSLYDDKTSDVESRSAYMLPNSDCVMMLAADARHILLLGGKPRRSSEQHYAYVAKISDILGEDGLGWSALEYDNFCKSEICPAACSVLNLSNKL